MIQLWVHVLNSQGAWNINQHQLNRFEAPNHLLSHQISSPVKALPSTPQETSFYPILNQGLEPPELCFMACFQNQLWLTALGNIIWGVFLENSYFPQTSRLHMNPKDQINTSTSLYKPKTLKNLLKLKPETSQNLGIHCQHRCWVDAQCREMGKDLHNWLYQWLAVLCISVSPHHCPRNGLIKMLDRKSVV